MPVDVRLPRGAGYLDVSVDEGIGTMRTRTGLIGYFGLFHRMRGR
jgi:hypothetical protein